MDKIWDDEWDDEFMVPLDLFEFLRERYGADEVYDQEAESRRDLEERERFFERTLQQIRAWPVTYLHPDKSENL